MKYLKKFNESQEHSWIINIDNIVKKDIFKNIPDIREKVEIGDIVIGVWYPEGTFLLEIENLYEHGDGEIVLGACDNNSDYKINNAWGIFSIDDYKKFDSDFEIKLKSTKYNI